MQINTLCSFIIHQGQENYFKLLHCVKSDRIRSYSDPHSVLMRENVNQKNSEYGHFLRSASY